MVLPRYVVAPGSRCLVLPQRARPLNVTLRFPNSRHPMIVANLELMGKSDSEEVLRPATRRAFSVSPAWRIHWDVESHRDLGVQSGHGLHLTPCFVWDWNNSLRGACCCVYILLLDRRVSILDSLQSVELNAFIQILLFRVRVGRPWDVSLAPRAASRRAVGLLSCIRYEASHWAAVKD